MGWWFLGGGALGAGRRRMCVESYRNSPTTVIGERYQLTELAIGFNVRTGQLRNFHAAGILDPTKTLRVALDAEFSCAQEILKTDTWTASPAARDAQLDF